MWCEYGAFGSDNSNSGTDCERSLAAPRNTTAGLIRVTSEWHFFPPTLVQRMGSAQNLHPTQRAKQGQRKVTSWGLGVMLHMCVTSNASCPACMYITPHRYYPFLALGNESWSCSSQSLSLVFSEANLCILYYIAAICQTYQAEDWSCESSKFFILWILSFCSPILILFCCFYYYFSSLPSIQLLITFPGKAWDKSFLTTLLQIFCEWWFLPSYFGVLLTRATCVGELSALCVCWSALSVLSIRPMDFTVEVPEAQIGTIT